MAIKYEQRPFAVTTSNTTKGSLSRESGTTGDDRIVVINTATDDAVGGWVGVLGAVNYVGKTANIKVIDFDRKTSAYKSDYENASAFETAVADGGGSGNSSGSKGGEYGTASVGEEMFAGSSMLARYRVAPAVPLAKTMTFTPPAVSFDLCPYTSDAIVPGSVQFTWMGETCVDFEGRIYRGRTDLLPGIDSGVIEYDTGLVTMHDYVVGAGALTLQSLWTRRAPWKTASLFMRTQAAPIKPTGFVLNLLDTTGAALTAVGDLSGNLTGAHMRGKIDYLTGLVELQFGDYVLDTSLTPEQKLEWWYDASDVGAVQVGKIWRPWPVDPTSLRYNSVAYFYLPIDADLLGLDPVRLPQDGRVPIFRVGSYVVVGHTGEVPAATVSNGQTINFARTRLSRVRVTGSDGAVINTGYTADLDAGTLTVVDASTWAQPVKFENRIEDLVRCSDVQINGQLTFTRQLSHDFPVGSIVSSALIAGDLKGRVSHLFGQATWVGNSWADTVTGAASIAQYNDAVAPIVVTNAGTLTERWVLRFTNSTAFDLIGEHVGLIATGTINADFAPVNPISGTPYFTMAALGWGGGWAAGNILRINTVGAMTPFAAIRTVQQGIAAGIDYSFELLGRGDVDRPPSAP